MISQVLSALARAMFVAVLICTPSLLLPDQGSEATQVVALIALAAAALTMIEYSASYPSLVEFRDAPPFNRIRFLSIFATVFLLSVISRADYDYSGLTVFCEALGIFVGHVFDFPFSPVRLVLLSLPPEATLDQIDDMRSAAGLAFFIAIAAVAFFYLIMKLKNWPSRTGAFNVWINLPTFDPTAGGDVVERLKRDGQINLAFGFLLPFLMPAVAQASTSLFGPLMLDSPHTMIWTVALWSFLPVSLFMRGIAMGRVAAMIEEKRRRSTGAEHQADFVPV